MKCELVVDKRHYFPGEVMDCLAVVNVPKKSGKKLWKISVRFRGEEFCYFKNTLFVSRNELRDAHVRNERVIVDQEGELWKRPEDDMASNVMPSFVGKEQRWAFKVLIPAHAVTSFTHKYGYVRYTLTLRMDHTPARVVRSDMDVHVVAPVEILRRNIPCKYVMRQEFAPRWCCMGSGFIHAEISVEDNNHRRGLPLLYTIEDKAIVAKVSIRNESDMNITWSRLELVRETRLRYTAVRSQLNEPEKNYVRIISVTVPGQGWFAPNRGHLAVGGVIQDQTTELSIPADMYTVAGERVTQQFYLRLMVQPSRGSVLETRLPVYLCAPVRKDSARVEMVGTHMQLHWVQVNGAKSGFDGQVISMME